MLVEYMEITWCYHNRTEHLKQIFLSLLIVTECLKTKEKLEVVGEIGVGKKNE